MPLFLDCSCDDCGKKFKLTDDYLLCLKADKLVEVKFSPLTCYEIKGDISKTFCNNCGKYIKIYNPLYMGEEDKNAYIDEIKQYLTNTRPRNTINVFMEEYSSDTIVCLECNNDVSLGFVDMDKCPNCGSKKFEVNGLIVDY